MRRRKFILALGAALLTGGIAVPVSAQTTKIARVGILFGASISTHREAFVESLRKLGWEEGRNLIVEARATEGRAERFAEHAAELVALQVDVAVGTNSQAVQALKDKTRTIPIVMLNTAGPVEQGFIVSLARPGGNITGVTNQLNDLIEKLLGLLLELKPGLDRAGVLYTPSNAASALAVKQGVETIPERLGVSLVPVPIDSPADIDTAFAIIDREGLRAAAVHPTPVIASNRARIASLLIERRMLTVTGTNTLVRDGILMSYGPDQVEFFRVAAAYVDRILRGAKPADLPVEQPTKFLFVINLKTAKAIGVDISPTLLARADEVIE